MSYPGGKNGSGVYQTIINQIPPHRVYVEPFLGGGAIMRRKKPAEVNVGIDKSQEALDLLGDCGHESLVQLVRGCGIRWLGDHKDTVDYVGSRDAFVYCDPPYLIETRKSQREIYEFEMTPEQHMDLLTVIRELPCMVMISGYWSQMYHTALLDWRVVTFDAQTRGGGTATEYLWMNYPEPVRLHDAQYLGENFTDRQRIKRKIERNVRRIMEMPRLERAALLDALDAVGVFDIDGIDGDG